jgi:transposase InsO family protein
MKVDGPQAFPGKGRLKEDEEEIRRLKRDLNLFSRRLVGWAMDEHIPDKLTQAALEMAILQRRPSEQLLHHAD